MEEPEVQSLICDVLHNSMQRQRNLSGADQFQASTVVDPRNRDCMFFCFHGNDYRKPTLHRCTISRSAQVSSVWRNLQIDVSINITQSHEDLTLI
jgi:hypothetical protein